MPCRDDYPHTCAECRKKHVSDMSDDALLEEIAHRKAVREADARVAAKRNKEIAARNQKIKTFVANAQKCLTKVAPGEVINFVAAEDGKSEIQHWRRDEFVEKFEGWLKDCKPMPTSMMFNKAEQKHGQWFLHSYHTH